MRSLALSAGSWDERARDALWWWTWCRLLRRSALRKHGGAKRLHAVRLRLCAEVAVRLSATPPDAVDTGPVAVLVCCGPQCCGRWFSHTLRWRRQVVGEAGEGGGGRGELTHFVIAPVPVQAMKNNAENMPATLLLTQNYISNAGKVAIKEAMEDMFDLYEREMVIEF